MSGIYGSPEKTALFHSWTSVISVTACTIAHINGTYNSVFMYLYSPLNQNLYFQLFINMIKYLLEA